jgi:hypothetical protein
LRNWLELDRKARGGGGNIIGHLATLANSQQPFTDATKGRAIGENLMALFVCGTL